MTYEKRIAESSEESDDAIGLKVAYQLSDAENSDYKKAFAKVLEVLRRRHCRIRRCLVLRERVRRLHA